MKKIYVLDTNVLMYDPKALFAFDDNEVVIPFMVLDELDKHKNGNSQASKHTRMTIRSLDELRALGSINKGVKTECGGSIRVEVGNNTIPEGLDPECVDNKIIGVALELQNAGGNIILISKDINLRVKCDSLGLSAEDYSPDDIIKNLDSMYSGHSTIYVESSDIDSLYAGNGISVAGTQQLFTNEYVHLRSNVNTQHTALARYDGKELKNIKIYQNIWGISPRNKEQTMAIDALFNPDIKLVTITGLAGSGKTLISAAAGVSQLLDSKVYNKIIMTRPIVPLGRDIGFLPGDLGEKMKPWMAPLFDSLELIFSDKGQFYLDGLIDVGKIEIQPLTYIRGRSMPNSFIIVDEAQQLTRHEVKAMLTRVGEGSKVCLLGDVEQIDTPLLDSFSNGLSYAIETFKKESLSAHIKLIKGERSELATISANLL